MRNKLLLCVATAGVLFLGSCKKNENPVKTRQSASKNVNWVPGDPIVRGAYKITNVGSTLAASYVTNGSNPQLMVQNAYSDLNNNQRWSVIPIDATYYQIINITLNKALSAYNTSNGWQLELRPYSAADQKQKWKIEHISGGAYKLTTQASPGLSAAVTNTGAGLPVLNSTSAANNFQRWNFTPVAYQDDVVTNYFKRTTGSQAFDGNFSIPLSSGKVIWFTNDVHYDQMQYFPNGNVACLFNYRNSVMEQPAATNWTAASTTTYVASGQPNVVNGSPQLFWHANSIRWIWQGAGVQIGNYVYTYCNELEKDTTDPMGFKVVGAFLGNLNLTNKQVNYQNLPALNGINFGIGMVQNGTDVYVYGYKPPVAGLGVNIYVAKFATATPTAWTFWNGSAFVASASSAVSIGQGASSGAFVSKVNGKYVMMSTAFTVACNQGTNIFSNFSANPTGPFSPLKVIYSIPDRDAGHTPYFYAAIIHPQATANNELLLTYCINYYKPCVNPCVNGGQNPNGYRPRGVRVPFSVIDPAF